MTASKLAIIGSGVFLLLLTGIGIAHPSAVSRLGRSALWLGPPDSVPPGLVHEGDLVFQTSRSSQSAAVAMATHSPLTHMGIIEIVDGRPEVLEAVKQLKRTPLEAWIARGEGGHVLIRRLRDASQALSPSVLGRMHSVGEDFIGRAYDVWFRWDDTRVYCSELVYKIYERGAGIRIGKLQRAGDMDLASPVVQPKLRERFGPGTPFAPDEPVISPQAMFDDPRLVTVLER